MVRRLLLQKPLGQTRAFPLRASWQSRSRRSERKALLLLQRLRFSGCEGHDIYRSIPRIRVQLNTAGNITTYRIIKWLCCSKRVRPNWLGNFTGRFLEIFWCSWDRLMLYLVSIWEQVNRRKKTGEETEGQEKQHRAFCVLLAKPE